MEAKLTLQGSNVPIKVLDFSFGFTQYTDETGKAAGYPTGGEISLTIEEKEKDTQILDWMLSSTGLKNGKIELQIKNERVIEFTNALCTSYNESFSHMGGDQPLNISITISAESISIRGIEFKQKRKTI